MGSLRRRKRWYGSESRVYTYGESSTAFLLHGEVEVAVLLDHDASQGDLYASLSELAMCGCCRAESAHIPKDFRAMSSVAAELEVAHPGYVLGRQRRRERLSDLLVRTACAAGDFDIEDKTPEFEKASRVIRAKFVVNDEQHCVRRPEHISIQRVTAHPINGQQARQKEWPGRATNR